VLQNHELLLKNDANHLGAICDAVISKVEDWGSKVKKQLKLQSGTFLSGKHSSKKTAKYVNAIQLAHDQYMESTSTLPFLLHKSPSQPPEKGDSGLSDGCML
jgi:hypothetical protein